MPPSVIVTNNSSNRRSTGSLRHRENRAHPQHTQTSSGSVRRPDALEEVQPPNDSRRKKRLPPIPSAAPSSSNSSSMGVSRPSMVEDTGDSGRAKVKSKPKAFPMYVEEDHEDISIVTNIVQARHPPNNNAQSARAKRRERSRSREVTHRHSRKIPTPEPMNEAEDMTYTGPLAHAEYTRMKQEMDSLRRQAALAKKTISKQSKVIDELRAELTNTNETHRIQRVEIEKLKSQSKNSDDLIATIESNLTCQICMEILFKPFGLAPCGHVLCMNCLLRWFRSAPPGEDDMHDDDYPTIILYRKKTCPCCRAVVRNRPIPLYLVKSLVSALDKSKAPAGTVRPSPPPDEEDPWAGIFRDPVDDYWSTDDDDDDVDDDDDEERIMFDEEDDYWSFDGYGTGEDEDRYDGPYVNPRWAPPSVYVSTDEFTFLDEDAEEFTMLRRGATLGMIGVFQMSYNHDTGLCAIVDGENAVYLGWNVELHPDDQTGEEYMDWILTDMYERPERWRVENDDEEGTWNAWKLVPEDEAEDYDNTDSEAWAEDLAADESDDF